MFRDGDHVTASQPGEPERGLRQFRHTFFRYFTVFARWERLQCIVFERMGYDEKLR